MEMEVIPQRTKIKNVLIYFIAIIFSLIYFVHAFLPHRSEAYLSALNSHKKEMAKRAKIRSEVVELSKGTPLYEEYLKQKKITDKAWNIFLKVQKEERVFGFKSFRVFIEIFWYSLIVLIFAIYFLVRSFYFDYENVGVKVVCGSVISIAVFKLYWLFQQFQDLSPIAYVFVSVITAFLIVMGIYLVTKRKELYVDKMNRSLMVLGEKALVNSKPEKRAEMHEFIKQLLKK